MVERQLDRQPPHRVPVLLNPVLLARARLSRCDRHDRDVGDGQHVAAWIASRHDDMAGAIQLLGPVKGLELLDPAAVDPCDADMQGARL